MGHRYCSIMIETLKQKKGQLGIVGVVLVVIIVVTIVLANDDSDGEMKPNVKFRPH